MNKKTGASFHLFDIIEKNLNISNINDLKLYGYGNFKAPYNNKACLRCFISCQRHKYIFKSLVIASMHLIFTIPFVKYSDDI